MSYLLHDPDGAPWVIFTGDALFAGEVGRVDFLGMDRAEEMAGHLYDTLFVKFLPLGDGVVVCPAHGSGSVCGSAIAERVWTTIGLERRYNPKLQLVDRAEFVAGHVRELEKAPYFKRMEQWNLEGAPLLGTMPKPPALSPDEFVEIGRDGVVLDTRMEVSFCAAHVPNALSIWLGGVPSFAGWFLPYDKPILLVNETEDPSQAIHYLARIGYDNIGGYLSGGMLAWHKAGRESSSIQAITVQKLCHYLDTGADPWILDVRGDDEVAAGPIAGAHHIHVTQLPERLDELPRDRTIYIFCGSGLRSTTAASLLRREGWQDVVTVLGGLIGWESTTCPIDL
jgi:hydroxyacylglutathione hydrolase